ncbi:MAG: phosphoribosyltransferase [Chloroflexi bacterium]|nr:phosphoribosyltransferase [Chloroflexota bacterium]
MRFRDRQEAGQLLARVLIFLKGKQDVIVLGIPRGGVVVAAEVAKAIGAPLDVYITRKIGAPYNPELAIGAIAGSGEVVLDAGLIGSLGVSPEYVQDETERQRREIERRLRKYRGDQPAQELEGKTVLLVDDGIATGATTLAAIRALKKQKLAELILAVPVGPPDVVARLRGEVDRLVCLDTPQFFWAVGAFYEVFDQTSDEEVVRLLRESQSETNDVSRFDV